MAQITLTDEQTQILTHATDGVEVRDRQGKLVAVLQPLDVELAKHIEIAKTRHRRSGPGIPSAVVQAHLRRLEEISQRETLTEERVLEILRRLRAGEEP